MQFKDYLTFENIYLWINFGVLPLWLMLIFVPNSKFTQIFVNSIIAPLIIASAYVYTVHQIILLDEGFFNVFNLYLSLDGLYTLFASESFLLLFWLHFVAINLFLGSWISKDSIKYGLPRGLVLIPLITVYFTGPVGLVFYWFVRIFYAKKLRFHD